MFTFFGIKYFLSIHIYIVKVEKKKKTKQKNKEQAADQQELSCPPSSKLNWH